MNDYLDNSTENELAEPAVPGTQTRKRTAADRQTHKAEMNRRTVLSWMGGIIGTAIVSGCGGGGGSSSTTGTTSTGTTSTGTTTTGTTTGGSSSCSVTPEGEVGPYFTDDSASGFNRSNILRNIDGSNTQTGIPLTLAIYVYDAENNCTAMSGVQIDIWHCNALGVYSNEAVENTSSQTYLRGYQTTDTNGLVTFKTIIPGWYQGRTQHIHLRLRSKYSSVHANSDGSNTTQLFFPQTTVDYISKNVSPYNTKGIDTTTNTSDHVYSGETQGEMEMTLTGDYTNGFSASVAIHLPITQSY